MKVLGGLARRRRRKFWVLAKQIDQNPVNFWSNSGHGSQCRDIPYQAPPRGGGGVSGKTPRKGSVTGNLPPAGSMVLQWPDPKSR